MSTVALAIIGALTGLVGALERGAAGASGSSSPPAAERSSETGQPLPVRVVPSPLQFRQWG